jgi:hypothetical protein
LRSVGRGRPVVSLVLGFRPTQHSQLTVDDFPG